MTTKEAYGRFCEWTPHQREVIPNACEYMVTPGFGQMLDAWPAVALAMVSLVGALHDTEDDTDLLTGILRYIELRRQDKFSFQDFTEEYRRLSVLCGVDPRLKN